MDNLHIPQRLEGESFSAYSERRAKSHAANKANRTIGQGGVSSRRQYRDSMRESGTMGKKTRAYVALTAAWASKRVVKWDGARDEHGAYTLVGSEYIGVDGGDTYRPRRKWLAGISAQRGY